jgi:hypothetical protein
MPKFKTKPLIVEAEQFTAPNDPRGAMFMSWPVQEDFRGYFISVPTADGVMRADEGDWIIRGVNVERYMVCKNDVFWATHEPAEVQSWLSRLTTFLRTLLSELTR